MTVEEIAQMTGAEAQLICMMAVVPFYQIVTKWRIDRILRYLAAIDAVAEVSANQYAANNVTRNLTESVVEAGLGHL